MNKFIYTGVGARATPDNIIEAMSGIAEVLTNLGGFLRTGNAQGADTAFARGVNDDSGHPVAKVYHHDHFVRINGIVDTEYRYDPLTYVRAADIAQEVHPAWRACSHFARMLHTRNVFQILGEDLDQPSDFMLCWTPDGCEDGTKTTRNTGGTGQAIRIAHRCGVPVINMANPGLEARLQDQIAIALAKRAPQEASEPI